MAITVYKYWRFGGILPLLGLLAFTVTPAVAGPIITKITAQQLAGESGSVIEIAERRKKRRRSRRSSSRRSSRGASSAASARAALKSGAPADTSKLFGTVEKKSITFKTFKKWNGAMKRMAAEQSNLAAFKKRFKDWIKVLDSLRGKDPLTQVKAVNKLMNQSKYIQDNKNWGIKDYWASPGEFLNKFGDCEDYSIAKYMALKYLGHDPAKMRIVAVRDMNLKVGHAILAYYFKDRIVLLDNQIKIVVDSRKVRHYQPVYSINETAWWRHRPAV